MVLRADGWAALPQHFSMGRLISVPRHPINFPSFLSGCSRSMFEARRFNDNDLLMRVGWFSMPQTRAAFHRVAPPLSSDSGVLLRGFLSLIFFFPHISV